MSMFWNPLAGWKEIVKRIAFSSGVLFSLIFLINACAKDPDNLGRDLLPSSDDIYVKTDSSTVISSYTISGKRILTSANELYVLGSQKDSIFGYSNASILTQFHPKLLISIDSLRSADSLVLYLSPANFFGDSLNEMTLRVHELNQKMTYDSSYFSDINPSEYYSNTSELAHTTFALGDSIIRVKIEDPEFLSKFESLPDSVFRDREDFEEEFYGMHISVDPVSEKGGFVYLNMSSLDSKLTFYYNGDTISKTYDLAFTTLVAKANAFTHEYSGFPIETNLNVPNSDSLIYIDGLAGSSGHISFPDLEAWKSKGMITINKAELIFPVDTIMYPSLFEENYPPNLLLFALEEDGTYTYLYDYRIDQTGSYFDGSYDESQHAYVFNIGLHLQSFISGKIENSDLVLVSRRSNSAANKVILKGESANSSSFRLKIIYTELF